MLRSSGIKLVFNSVVVSLIHVFETKNYSAYVVGGAVRDNLLNRDVYDIDITTSATPDEVKNLFEHVILTGEKFGTVTVHYKGHEFQITTFRVDKDYTDNRHPDQIEFGTSLQEDLSRRDFTMNAIAYNPTTNLIVDPYDGQTAIKNQEIQTVGTPEERLNEDTLRVFRCFRFVSQLGFHVEPQLKDVLQNILGRMEWPSMERVTQECHKLLNGHHLKEALTLLHETGNFKSIFEGVSYETLSIEEIQNEPEIRRRWALLYQHHNKPTEGLKFFKFSKQTYTYICQLIYHGCDVYKATFKVTDLALSGQDLKTMGYEGQGIGDAQKKLKQAVLYETIQNTKETLSQYLIQMQ